MNWFLRLTCGVWNDWCMNWVVMTPIQTKWKWISLKRNVVFNKTWCRRLVLKCDWELTITHFAKLEVILLRWKHRYFFAVERRKRRENIRGMCINSDFTYRNRTLNYFVYFVFLDDSCAIIYKIWKIVIFKYSFSLCVPWTSI